MHSLLSPSRESFLGPSRESWRTHYPFILLFYFNVFSSCVSYALVLPVIWLYLESSESQEHLVVYILSSFSFGEVLGAMIFGFLSDKFSTKSTLLTTLFIGLFGIILSLIATFWHPSFKIPIICAARFFQGMWNGGEQAVEQAYISEVVSDVSKLRALSEIGIAGICGYILGPVIGVVISIIDQNLYEDLRLDEYTAPGMLQLIIIVVMIIATFLKFHEIPSEMRVNRMQDCENYDKPNKFGVFTCILICFILFTGFTVQETITGPLVTDHRQVLIT